MPVLLRLQGLWSTAQTQARRLLRLLLLWLGPLSTYAIRQMLLMDTPKLSTDLEFDLRLVMMGLSRTEVLRDETGHAARVKAWRKSPMIRRGISWLATLITVFAALPSGAQQVVKLPRLCFLTFDPGTAESPSKRYASFFDGLRELGHVHGQTIFIDYLADEGRGDLFPALAAECLRRKSGIIAVTTTPAAKAAKAATSTIPIVMISLGDPVRTGLVQSLARPEGNITGMSNMGSELAAIRLALLKETVPSLTRVLVLTYALDPI